MAADGDRICIHRLAHEDGCPSCGANWNEIFEVWDRLFGEGYGPPGAGER